MVDKSFNPHAMSQADFLANAWASFIQFSIHDKDTKQMFEAATGLRCPPDAVTEIDSMIDQACGMQEVRNKYSEAFIVWASIWLWGLDLAPPSVQAMARCTEKIGKWDVQRGVEEAAAAAREDYE